MKIFFTALFILISVPTILAQQPPSQGAPPPQLPAPSITSATANTGLYQVGPDDVLDVRVFNHPEFGGLLTVQSDGTIRVPFFDGSMNVACKTELQVQDMVRDKLLTLLRKPLVSVMVKDYRSRRASVVGAVRTPTNFSLQRRARVLDLINASGGITQNAATFITIVGPTEAVSSCDEPLPPNTDGKPETIDLRLLLTGDPSVNRYIRVGEVIEVPEAGNAFLTGAVNIPRSVILNHPLTLSEAIAMAGGVQFAGKKDQIVITRSLASGKRDDLKFNLAEIQKNSKADPILQDNDVIFVPTSQGKNIAAGIAKTFVANPAAIRTAVY